MWRLFGRFYSKGFFPSTGSAKTSDWFLINFSEGVSDTFSACIHFSQQVPERRTLQVLTKDWPKFKNCTKPGTQSTSTFKVNDQTGEHHWFCPLRHEISIPTIRHVANLHLNCSKAYCILSAVHPVNCDQEESSFSFQCPAATPML